MRSRCAPTGTRILSAAVNLKGAQPVLGININTTLETWSVWTWEEGEIEVYSELNL